MRAAAQTGTGEELSGVQQCKVKGRHYEAGNKTKVRFHFPARSKQELVCEATTSRRNGELDSGFRKQIRRRFEHQTGSSGSLQLPRLSPIGRRKLNHKAPLRGILEEAGVGLDSAWVFTATVKTKRCRLLASWRIYSERATHFISVPGLRTEGLLQEARRSESISSFINLRCRSCFTAKDRTDSGVDKLRGRSGWLKSGDRQNHRRSSLGRY